MAENLKLVADLEELETKRQQLITALCETADTKECEYELHECSGEIASLLPDILAALKSADTSHQQQTLMRLALSLSIPVKDLAERGVDEISRLKKDNLDLCRQLGSQAVQIDDYSAENEQLQKAFADLQSKLTHETDKAYNLAIAVGEQHQELTQRQWRDISSAPKGGGAEMVTDTNWVQPPRILLLFPDGNISVAYWDWYYAEGGGGFTHGVAWVEPCSGELVNQHFGNPTHWQPLPPANTKTGQAGEAGEEG